MNGLPNPRRLSQNVAATGRIDRMADVVEDLRAWAAEIAKDKEGHATWKEDCRVLNQAAKEVERLREENKRLRRGDK